MGIETKALKPKDFKSDQDVKWCPGCGDYAILGAVQKTLPRLDVPKEKHVFVAGIGCSSRFPYYMNTYGFHTIHGRGPAVATGIKTANPDLTVWLISGDGDALSIGGNHFLHVLRKNLDINYIVFNNEIYGLTKGQVSPTSRPGTVSKTTLGGSDENPVNVLNLAAGSGATFIARVLDMDSKHMSDVFEAAAKHKGTSFVEVYQNCIIFNDGAFDHYSRKATKDQTTVHVEHNKPLVFDNGNKGLRLNGFRLEVVDLTTGQYTLDDLYFHNQHEESEVQTILYGELTTNPDKPTPIGIFRSVQRSTLDDRVTQKIDDAIAKKGKGDIEKLLNSGNTWEVK